MFSGHRPQGEEPERGFQTESGLGFFYWEQVKIGYSMSREEGVRW